VRRADVDGRDKPRDKPGHDGLEPTSGATSR
jgi:hypothetical protein